MAAVWELENLRIYLYGKKLHLYTDHEASEPLNKRNRSKKQNSEISTMVRLPNSSLQRVASSNSNFTDYLSRSLVGGAIQEEIFDELYVINTLTEQTKLNIKYGPLFPDQSICNKTKIETKKGASEDENERYVNQSHTKRTFGKKYSENYFQQIERTAFQQYKTSTSNSGCSLKGNSKTAKIQNSSKNNTEFTEMDGKNFNHWGATRKIMEILRRRNISPETHKLIEGRNALSRTGTLRRRYDHHTQRTVFAPSRLNKRSRAEIDMIDSELTRRANRLGGSYQPKIEEVEEPKKIREEVELEQKAAANPEEVGVIMQGDNLPIVDLSKHNKEEKVAHYN